VITLHHNYIIYHNRQWRHNSQWCQTGHAVYRTLGPTGTERDLYGVVSRDIGYEVRRVNETGPVWIPVSNPATARRGVTRAARLQPTRVPRACVGWEGATQEWIGNMIHGDQKHRFKTIWRHLSLIILKDGIISGNMTLNKPYNLDQINLGPFLYLSHPIGPQQKQEAQLPQRNSASAVHVYYRPANWSCNAQNTAEVGLFLTFKRSASRSAGRKRILSWNSHSRSFNLISVGSVAFPVPEIIGGTPKNWAVPGHAHTPFSQKNLMGFCSDGPSECTGQIWSS